MVLIFISFLKDILILCSDYAEMARGKTMN